MKKFFCLIIAGLCMTFCSNYNANHTGPNGEIRTDAEAYLQKHVEFFDIYHEGEWHEYVMYSEIYRGGIDHWPGCRFCKEKSNK